MAPPFLVETATESARRLAALLFWSSLPKRRRNVTCLARGQPSADSGPPGSLGTPSCGVNVTASISRQYRGKPEDDGRNWTILAGALRDAGAACGADRDGAA